MLAERLPVQNTSSIQTVELPPDNDSSEAKFPQADLYAGGQRSAGREPPVATAPPIYGDSCVGSSGDTQAGSVDPTASSH
jgi:hypothetical protein